MEKQQQQVAMECAELLAQIHTVRAEHENTLGLVRNKEDRIQQLTRELQQLVKLQASKEQLSIAKRQNENCEETTRALESQVAELMDATRAQATQLDMMKEMLTKSLDSARAEKNELDKNRLEINTMLETLSADYEKVQKAISRFQKVLETLEDEKAYLQIEMVRLDKEAEMRALITEEDRWSRLREELLTVRENLNKAYLAKDKLEQHKAEAEILLAQMEKSRGEVELELERVLLERSDVHESLSKTENLVVSLEHDKKRLMDEVRQLEQEKAALQSQVVDQNNDLGSLRKELLAADQMRLDLDSEKVSLHEKLKFLEIEKEKAASSNSLNATRILTSLLRVAECPVCLETIKIPFKMCANGHGICSCCTEKHEACPTCRGAFVLENPVSMKKLLEAFPKLCRYDGCEKLLQQNDDHEGICGYRPIVCRAHSCDETVLLMNILEHCKSEHPKIYICEKEIQKYFCPLVRRDVAFGHYSPVSLFGNLFWFFTINDIHDQCLKIFFQATPIKKLEKDYYAQVKVENGKFAYSSTLKASLVHNCKVKYNKDNQDSHMEAINGEDKYYLRIPQSEFNRFINDDGKFVFQVSFFEETET